MRVTDVFKLFTVLLMCFAVYTQGSNSYSRANVTTAACSNGTTSSGTSGNISSSNYPNEYNDNQKCTWIVQNQPNKVIRIWFLDQRIEADTSCIYDYLTVHVGRELLGGRKYCGVDKPRDFVTKEPHVTFFFSSDQTIREAGFFITWQLLDACPTSNFTCWDGECIPLSSHCNGVRDCHDDSDEVECVHNTTLWSNASECGKPSVATSFSWDERIIGGSRAPHGAYPWQVMLVYSSSNRHFCGGSIIDKKWVITAAHCTNTLAGPGDVNVYVGRHRYGGNEGEVVHHVKKYFVHEKYFKWTLRADIAMFQLVEAIIFTDFVKPICIPNLNSTFYLKPKRTCLASGWGSIYPDRQVFPEVLQQVRVPIVKRSLCESLYAAKDGGSIPLNTICAADTEKGGVDSCVGDSGGPLVCLVNEAAFYLFGLTSFGEGCADRKYPGVYTNISAYYDWIQSVMQENEPKSSPDQDISKNVTLEAETTSLPATTTTMSPTISPATTTTMSSTISLATTTTMSSTTSPATTPHTEITQVTTNNKVTTSSETSVASTSQVVFTSSTSVQLTTKESTTAIYQPTTIHEITKQGFTEPDGHLSTGLVNSQQTMKGIENKSGEKKTNPSGFGGGSNNASFSSNNHRYFILLCAPFAFIRELL